MNPAIATLFARFIVTLTSAAGILVVLLYCLLMALPSLHQLAQALSV